jgi:vacuolar protein sorting-associated protein 8
VEYLLSVYHPPDLQSLIPLFKEARFFRVLKSTYRSEKQFAELIIVYIEEGHDQQSVFTCIQDCLRPGSRLSKKQQRDVLQVIQSYAGQLVRIDTVKAAQTIEDFAPELHEYFLHALDEDERRQYEYLAVILQPENKSTSHAGLSAKLKNWMIERYVRLMCKYDPFHVADYVDALRAGDLRLEEVLPSMEDSGVVDAAVILLARQGQVRNAMDRLISHLGTLESGLLGILQNANDSPDSSNTAEAINDLAKSLDKYSGVGTWLCQGQTKTAIRARNGIKAGKRGTAIYHSPLSFEENLWLDLIDAVVRIARNVTSLLKSDDANTQKALPSQRLSNGNSTYLTSVSRSLVQQVFTALLTCTTKAAGPSSSERSDVSFLRILRAFLTHAASWSPSLSELRAVLASIFSAYTYEKSLLTLANSILDRDLFVHVDEVTKLRQRGWRPRGQVCEICRRRVWGPGAGTQLWAAWEKRQTEEIRNRETNRLASRANPGISRGKGKQAATSCESGSIEQQYPNGRVSYDDDENNRGYETQVPPGGQRDDDEDSGPVMVFACRHLYHRQCLLNVLPCNSSEGHHTDPGDPHGQHDPGPELSCLACT